MTGGVEGAGAGERRLRSLPRIHVSCLRIRLEGFLLFYQLDNRLLWGDEAETALLAKNVLRFGIPKTTDGM